MTYEVRAYKTQADFDDCHAVVILDGITRKREALREGRAWLIDHAVVKVQSEDREFIDILTSTTTSK